jgi:hypothetical protein
MISIPYFNSSGGLFKVCHFLGVVPTSLKKISIVDNNKWTNSIVLVS